MRHSLNPVLEFLAARVRRAIPAARSWQRDSDEQPTTTFIEGQLVQPMLVGRRLELNPLLIFLALWLGGFYWGIAGVILATPVLVAFKVIAENAINGKPLIDFLGPNHSSPARRVLRGGLQRVVGGRA
jgi:hypothetical protein